MDGSAKLEARNETNTNERNMDFLSDRRTGFMYFPFLELNALHRVRAGERKNHAEDPRVFRA
jgi:hypothetical protein